MIGFAPGLIVLALTPVILALLRNRPTLMRFASLLACVLPFLLPPGEPLFRAAAALLSWLFLVKTLQFTAGHAVPRGLVDLLQFLTIPAVVRWETPRRRDLGRAGRTLLTSAMQLGLALALMLVVLRLDSRHPIQLFTTQIGIYLGLAGTMNLATLTLALRGLDHDDAFDNPFLSRTPGEFWGRRWNTWMNHMLFRYLFVPLGGWRHPVRGTLAAFAVSAAVHEGFVSVGTRQWSGWMGGFFMVQGVLVALTSSSRAFRRLARHAPLVTWAFTLTAMLASGTMLVRGADGIDPSDAWRRCCK